VEGFNSIGCIGALLGDVARRTWGTVRPSIAARETSDVHGQV